MRWMWRPRVFTNERRLVPFMLTVSMVRVVESPAGLDDADIRSWDHESSDMMVDSDQATSRDKDHQHLGRATTMSKRKQGPGHKGRRAPMIPTVRLHRLESRRYWTSWPCNNNSTGSL
jgi:hypothetical protein